mmetsp:Transcript_72649/g.210308  ORF Transcript_72649/g.210308 Transcript_72649/m.210308 type:complete len:213 (-) Transcript_72649:116-754(-)
MITGRFKSLPASRTALTVLVDVQFTAGIAKPFALANRNKAQQRSPVMTPAFIPGMSQKLWRWATAGSKTFFAAYIAMLSLSTSHVVSCAQTMDAGQSKQPDPLRNARNTIGARLAFAAERTTRRAAQMKSKLTATLVLPPSLMGSTTFPQPEALISALLGWRLPTWPSSPVPSKTKSTTGMPERLLPTVSRGMPFNKASYLLATSSGVPSGT